MEGVTVGSYVVGRLLGKGGMGAVYLVEHALLKRPAALKVLLPALSADQELVERFFDEARATTSIPDPGIVQIFDFGHHVDGSAYFVMEYLDGESLDVRIERDGPMAVVPALRVGRQLAISLHAAHVHGVIHRDLKLENVFLISDQAVAGGERTKILDFGIAKLIRADGSPSRTRQGAIMGTPIYMSPEQCKGAADVDGRSDVYSLGCVLFTLLTGVPPFDYESAGEIIAAHLKEDPPATSALATEVPPEVDDLIARCLAKEPTERWGTMAELAAAITELLGDASDAPRAVTPAWVAVPGAVAPRYRSGPATASPVPTPTPAPVERAEPTTLRRAPSATRPGPPSPGVVAARRRLPWVFAGLAAILAAAGVLAIVSQTPPRARPAAPVAPPQVAPLPVAPGPAPTLATDAAPVADPSAAVMVPALPVRPVDEAAATTEVGPSAPPVPVAVPARAGSPRVRPARGAQRPRPDMSSIPVATPPAPAPSAPPLGEIDRGD